LVDRFRAERIEEEVAIMSREIEIAATECAGKGRYAGMSELHVAAFLGQAVEVQALVGQGAEIDAKARYDYSSMPELVALLNDAQQRKILKQQGVNLEARINDEATPLMMAAGHADEAAALALIKLGACVRATDKRGNTALHYAAEAGNAQVCRALLAAGASAGAARSRFWSDGTQPLILAAKQGSAEVCALLLDAGARWESVDTSASALHYAAEGGHIDACRVLVAHGADPDYRGSKKTKELYASPLLEAMKKDRVAVVRYFLLSCGADHRVTTRDGVPLKQLAQRKGRTDIMQLIDQLELSVQGQQAVTASITAAASGSESQAVGRPARRDTMSPI
jgi:ankyrin repeat protein